MGTREALVVLQVSEEGDRLQRLAQAHLVGEDAVDAVVVQRDHPVETLLLVVSELSSFDVLRRLLEHHRRVVLRVVGALFHQFFVLLLLALPVTMVGDFLLALRFGHQDRRLLFEYFSKVRVTGGFGVDEVLEEFGLAEEEGVALHGVGELAAQSGSSVSGHHTASNQHVAPQNIGLARRHDSDSLWHLEAQRDSHALHGNHRQGEGPADVVLSPKATLRDSVAGRRPV